MTRASYQFLMRMKLWDIMDDDGVELIMNRFALSKSRVITMEETKWIITQVFAQDLNEEQQAFFDLVLSNKEELVAH